MILASDKPFSHEILDDYGNAYFFDPFAEEDLMLKMKKLIKNKLKYKNEELIFGNNERNLYSEVIK
jgi:glycosyltransferase involved in cell wall biosynthesis